MNNEFIGKELRVTPKHMSNVHYYSGKQVILKITCNYHSSNQSDPNPYNVFLDLCLSEKLLPCPCDASKIMMKGDLATFVKLNTYILEIPLLGNYPRASNDVCTKLYITMSFCRWWRTENKLNLS